jgi:serine/threonine protein phosphatase PrpC
MADQNNPKSLDPRNSWHYRSVARTDTGRVRLRNEDNVISRAEAHLWAVVDGMGGHSRGDWASGLIKDELLSIALEDGLETRTAAVRDRLAHAHQRIRSEATKGPCGSTVVALVIEDGAFSCLWAGDSRLYRAANGHLERLTRDHSVVEELVAAGAISPSRARNHPLSNRITRAVGIEPTIMLDDITGDVESGDRFLLSSDGLHGLLDDEDIHRLAILDDLDTAADALLSAALEAGGTDNISLVLVAVDQQSAADAAGV